MPPLFYYFGACHLPLFHRLVAKEAGLVLWLSKPVFLCSPMSMFMFSHSVLCDSLQPHKLQPTRLLCPWDSPGKSTGVGCHFLLQGIFPTRGQNPCLLHWQAGFVCLFFLTTGEAQRKRISHISFSYLQCPSGISYSIIYFVPLLCLCQKRVTLFGAKSNFQEWTQGNSAFPLSA